MGRYAVRPRWHPSFTGQSLTRASSHLLGTVMRAPLTGDTTSEDTLRMRRAIFGAPTKEEAGSPTMSTSKGAMPGWSRQRGGATRSPTATRNDPLDAGAVQRLFMTQRIGRSGAVQRLFVAHRTSAPIFPADPEIL